MLNTNHCGSVALHKHTHMHAHLRKARDRERYPTSHTDSCVSQCQVWAVEGLISSSQCRAAWTAGPRALELAGTQTVCSSRRASSSVQHAGNGTMSATQWIKFRRYISTSVKLFIAEIQARLLQNIVPIFLKCIFTGSKYYYFKIILKKSSLLQFFHNSHYCP